jgi:hypothetical protein
MRLQKGEPLSKCTELANFNEDQFENTRTMRRCHAVY